MKLLKDTDKFFLYHRDGFYVYKETGERIYIEGANKYEEFILRALETNYNFSPKFLESILKTPILTEKSIIDILLKMRENISHFEVKRLVDDRIKKLVKCAILNPNVTESILSLTNIEFCKEMLYNENFEEYLVRYAEKTGKIESKIGGVIGDFVFSKWENSDVEYDCIGDAIDGTEWRTEARINSKGYTIDDLRFANFSENFYRALKDIDERALPFYNQRLSLKFWEEHFPKIDDKDKKTRSLFSLLVIDTELAIKHLDLLTNDIFENEYIAPKVIWEYVKMRDKFNPVEPKFRLTNNLFSRLMKRFTGTKYINNVYKLIDRIEYISFENYKRILRIVKNKNTDRMGRYILERGLYGIKENFKKEIDIYGSDPRLDSILFLHYRDRNKLMEELSIARKTSGKYTNILGMKVNSDKNLNRIDRLDWNFIHCSQITRCNFHLLPKIDEEFLKNHIKYRPGGTGYLVARDNFLQLSTV